MSASRPGDLAGPRPPAGLGRVLVALIVIAVGVLFLLDAAGTLDAGQALSDWWPVALIVLGLAQLAERPPSAGGPMLLVIAGAVLLAFSTGALEGDAWSYLWPVVLITAGVTVLLHARRPALPARDHGDADTVVASGILGGPKIASASPHFRGASLTAILGGVTLDLRRATPAAEGARINATSVLGGIDIIVPHGWRITTSGAPLLGGVEDKTADDEPPAPDAPSLHVDAVTVLGGIEIKHRP